MSADSAGGSTSGSGAPPTSPVHAMPLPNDPVRALEAKRAAELMLSSSARSSACSSINSLGSAAGPSPLVARDDALRGGDFLTGGGGGGPGPYYYPPSYGSGSQPPSYHSYPYYNYSPGPQMDPRGYPPPNISTGPPSQHTAPAPHQVGPPPMYPPIHQHQPPHLAARRIPPHLSHLQYSSVGGGYGSQHFPVIMTDDLVSGTQHGGKMSPVRRFFLLLLTFDILFTCLLWIISILVTGRDLDRELHQQVIEYTIHSSMFDCVVASAGRFLLCLLIYGMLDISHWWAITVTTTCTVVFLIAKVFQYQWHSQPITYDVMLVLLSFILAWGEAWFFDFRMIPLETKAKEIWGAQPQRSECQEEDERTPLLAGGGGEGGMLARYVEGSTLYEGSVRNFYSPFESPDASDDEDEVKEPPPS